MRRTSRTINATTTTTTMGFSKREWTSPTWCWLSLVVAASLVQSADPYSLTIMHTNDVHARYDQSSKYSSKCSAEDAAAGKCYGGYPRIYAKVKEIRENFTNTVLVDAGDQYQGTLWFYKYGGNGTSHFMNKIGYDVMALGNHEFDNGPDEVETLLKQANFSVVSSNTNASAYSDIASRLRKSVVKTIGGETVGFVGYTTTETRYISKPGQVTFSDELAAVKSEVEALTAQGVNKIVCVGHAGFTMDLRIAREVAGVDVVVGGHTNTFLYNGEPPSNEDPHGGYPEVVNRTDGTKVLVVQDYAFGKYLGFLQVEFDAEGKVQSWRGNPILLDNSTERDPGLQAELEVWQEGVEVLMTEEVGETAVFLEGSRDACRLRECSMGNLLSDAFVRQNIRHSDSSNWNHVAISILNGGSIRASIPKGPITVGDVLSVLSFRNTVDILELTGATLLEVMEHSASQWDPEEMKGGFLQHSGLHVVYNVTQPHGHRVKSVKVKCADCTTPQFFDLDPSKVYKVLVNKFMAEGGDNYAMLPEKTIKRHNIGDVDTDIMVEYIKQYSPITHGLEGRISFVSGDNGSPCTSAAGMGPSTSLTLIVTSLSSAFTWMSLLYLSMG